MAAAGTGALVWTEPTIKGLARRPAYAAVGSGCITIAAGTYDISGGAITIGDVTFDRNPGMGGPVWEIEISDATGTGLTCTFAEDASINLIRGGNTQTVIGFMGTSVTTLSGNITGGGPDDMELLADILVNCV